MCGSPIVPLPFLENIKNFIGTEDQIFAVDKGLEVCHTLGLPVKCIIGDFDSVAPDILALYPESSIHRFSANKDASDTELALSLALEEVKKQDIEEIIFLNASEGRPDHYMFNISLLFRAPGTIKLIHPTGILWALKTRWEHEINIPRNTIFSLIPLSPCQGVTVNNVKYPLSNADLKLSTRTLSNVAATDSDHPVRISLDAGNLILFIEDIMLGETNQ